MPIFEYRCKECGTVLEVLTHLGEKQEIRCEQCQSTNLEKMISAPFVSSGSSSSSGGTPSCCPGCKNAGGNTPPPCMR